MAGLADFQPSDSIPHYNVFVGSSIGYLKGVNYHKRTYRNLNRFSLGQSDDGNSAPDRNIALSSLCWADSDETSMLVGRSNGGVFSYDLSSESSEPLNLALDSEDGQLKEIKLQETNLISAFSFGIVKLFDTTDNSEASSGVAPSLTINSFSDGEKKSLQCMDHNTSISNTIVTGGCENSLKVWDLNASEAPIFKAKNIRNDWLNLRVPVWNTKVKFYPNSNKFVCGTGHGDVNMFDPSSSQRRPVIKVKCGETPITGFCVRPHSDYQVYVGNTTGLLLLVDLRKKAAVKTFKGLKGGITDIAAHPRFPVFSVCSVDRFVYCYDPDSPTSLIHSIYLKNSLTSLLCSSSWKREDYGAVSISGGGSKHKDQPSGGGHAAPGKDSESGSESDEDVWGNMEVVGGSKRGNVQSEAVPKKKKK